MKSKKEVIKFYEGDILTFQQVFDNEIEPLSKEDYNKRKEEANKSHNVFLNVEEWRKYIIWKTIKTEQIAVKLEDDKYEIKEIKYYSNNIKDLVHCQDNLDALFKYHPLLNSFEHDTFSFDDLYDGEIYDEDKKPAEIFNFFKRNFGEWCPRTDIKEAIQETLNHNEHNIPAEYFDTLEWDGEERLETFLIKYYNAADTKLNRVYFKRWMIALVKRVYNPGCKFDNMLVLVGEQGKKKSSLFEWLGTINGKNYCNHLPENLKDIKQLVYATKNAFIMMNDDFEDICDKGNIGVIKEFITKRNDRTDLKYKHAKDYPRHYVLCATTNSDTFLSDDKTFDERRFWIVFVDPKTLKFDLSDELKEQLYAEAVYYYKNDPNMDLWIHETELINEEKELQKKYKNAYTDPLTEKIVGIFNRKYYLPNDIFKSELQFLNAIQGREYEEYDGTSMEKKEEDFKYISIIPSAWVINWTAAGKRSTDRIVQILHSQGYKVEKLKGYLYNNMQLTCIRIYHQDK
jgi:predicted P-loop ATPase